jgi:hypothetical protein
MVSEQLCFLSWYQSYSIFFHGIRAIMFSFMVSKLFCFLTWYQSRFLWQWWTFPSHCWTRVWPKMPYMRGRVKVSHIAKRSLSCRLYKSWTPLLSQGVFWEWVRPMDFYMVSEPFYRLTPVFDPMVLWIFRFLLSLLLLLSLCFFLCFSCSLSMIPPCFSFYGSSVWSMGPVNSFVGSLSCLILPIVGYYFGP